MKYYVAFKKKEIMTHGNTDKHQGHYAKQSKPVTKGHILHDSSHKKD